MQFLIRPFQLTLHGSVDGVVAGDEIVEGHVQAALRLADVEPHIPEGGSDVGVEIGHL